MQKVVNSRLEIELSMLLRYCKHKF